MFSKNYSVLIISHVVTGLLLPLHEILSFWKISLQGNNFLQSKKKKNFLVTKYICRMNIVTNIIQFYVAMFRIPHKSSKMWRNAWISVHLKLTVCLEALTHCQMTRSVYFCICLLFSFHCQALYAVRIIYLVLLLYLTADGANRMSPLLVSFIQ